MNTQKAVYNGLFSKKTELETHKIELGLIQVLQAEFREYNSKASDAGGFILKAKQSLSKNVSLLEKVNKKIKDTIKKAQDLGITDKALMQLENKSEQALKEFKTQLQKLESL